jgi:hypothetical protein
MASPGMSAAAARLRSSEGPQLPTAVGAVSLALAAWVIDIRMTQWALGPRFIVVGVIAGLILAMGWSLPPAGPVARPHQSLLLISGLLVLILALQLLGQILAGHHHLGAGGQFWTFAVLAAIAVGAARRAASAGCTLIAAFAAAISLLAFVSWAFHPHGFGTFRWILFVESLALAAGAMRLRTTYRRHAVQLVNVAGVLALVLALTFLAGALIAQAQAGLGTSMTLGGLGSAGGGWKLYVLIATGALIAYAVMDREPAPGVIGVLLAFTFALLVGIHGLTGGSLVFWPLLLLIVGAVGLAVSLSSRPPSGLGAAASAPAATPPPPGTTTPPAGATPPSPGTSVPPPGPSVPPAAEPDPPGSEAE